MEGTSSLPQNQKVVFFDAKERALLLPANDKPFVVVSQRKDEYSLTRYKKMTNQRDQTEDRIAEGVIERLINDISLK